MSARGEMWRALREQESDQREDRAKGMRESGQTRKIVRKEVGGRAAETLIHPRTPTDLP